MFCLCTASSDRWGVCDLVNSNNLHAIKRSWGRKFHPCFKYIRLKTHLWVACSSCWAPEQCTVVYDRCWARILYPVYKIKVMNVWQTNDNFSKLKCWLVSWNWNSLFPRDWHIDDQKWPNSEAHSFNFIIFSTGSSLG